MDMGNVSYSQVCIFLRYSLYFVNMFKMKRALTFFQSEVTMEESLKMKVFRGSMKKVVFFTISHLQEHHNKMTYIRKTLLMNCGKGENPTFHIYILLNMNVSFLTLRTILKSLISSLIMEYFLGYFETPKAYQAYIALLLEMEPKTINEALIDEGWIKDMQEELD
ncbi:hypothetical protein CR513_19815, partial [Mucuna pruriens]